MVVAVFDVAAAAYAGIVSGDDSFGGALSESGMAAERLETDGKIDKTVVTGFDVSCHGVADDGIGEGAAGDVDFFLSPDVSGDTIDLDDGVGILFERGEF